MKIEVPSRGKLLALAFLFLAGCFSGLGLGWKLWQSKPGIPRPVPAPAVVQADGSVILAVKPEAKPQPKQELPAGAHVEHTISVTVQPTAIAPNSAIQAPLAGHSVDAQQLPAVAQPCPPVRVDLTLFRMPDGTRRVAVSSPDGRILPGASLDIPEDVAGPRRPKLITQAAGFVYGTTAWGDKAVGAFYDRDFKFLRTGVELTKNTYAIANRQGWEIRGKIGITF